MAAEYVALGLQSIALNSPVNFVSTVPCNRGWVYHDDGSGVFILRGMTVNQRFATYQVTFNGNIAIPEGGEVGPIALALTVNGEPRSTSRAIYTPAAVDEYGNVTSTAIIRVPSGCCFSISVEYVSGVTNDPTATPAPVINVIDGNLTISRIA